MAEKDQAGAPDAGAEDAGRAQEQRLAEIANRAAADHAKRVTAKYEKHLEERDAKIAALQAELESMRAPKAAAPEAADPTAAKLKELEARLAERDRRLEEERQAREAEKRQRLAEEERATTFSALAAVGASDPDAQRAAYALLREDRRIGRDDDGKIVFLVQREGYVDKVPVHEGVQKWAEGPGKIFLPPKGVAGSGNRPSATPGKAGKVSDRAARLAEARANLAAAFGMAKREE